MSDASDIIRDLQLAFTDHILGTQETQDGVDTMWVRGDRIVDILRYLKSEIDRPFRMLLDLSAIDERNRLYRDGQPESDFTIVYYLLSFDRNQDIRIKVPLRGEYPTMPSVTSVWPMANWYEREVWDMFGITFERHPNLQRILMPRNWRGHPLRREHPARRTEMPPFDFSEVQRAADEEVERFCPEDWGMARAGAHSDFMFLNLGPQHPGTHGVLRIILQLDGEIIVDAVPDIGYHHRAAEKMGERQSWHTYIPYTDRVDYLQGVMNNLPYVLSVEKLGGIDIPDRAKVIRIMLAELFRISSHLVWYGTFAQDVGAMSPVFYMFTDRERLLGIVEAICGARMHPNWFRIGGVSQDLPDGWQRLVRDFVEYLPSRLDEYDKLVMQNSIFRARTKGIGVMTLDDAIEWGVTGPALRACGLEWDFRKKRPYSGYDQFEFDIPTAQHGDCYDRAVVRVEEMRQSLRIIKQCLENMPEGSYKSDHRLTTPPLKRYTMQDIETLINHFLNVSWGPVVPAGEAMILVEATKGANGYYLISDGNTMPYRVRIRTPSFAHMQMLPLLTRGLMIPDLMAILGAMDYVLSDVDR